MAVCLRKILLNSVITIASRHVLMFHSLPGTSNAGYSGDEIQPLQMALGPFLKTYLLLGPHQDP
jgi:hypothetical protein